MGRIQQKKKINAVTAEDLGRICDHIDTIVNDYIKTEYLFDAASEEFDFVVNTGDSDEGWTSEDKEMDDLGISPE